MVYVISLTDFFAFSSLVAAHEVISRMIFPLWIRTLLHPCERLAEMFTDEHFGKLASFFMSLFVL